MSDLFKKFIELLPLVREAPSWFQVVFFGWACATAICAVCALVAFVRQPPGPPKLDGFKMEVPPYVETREIAITGVGLPEELQQPSLALTLYRLIDGAHQAEEHQAGPVRRVVTADGAKKWRYEWLRFSTAGAYEVHVALMAGQTTMREFDPITVHVAPPASEQLAALIKQEPQATATPTNSNHVNSELHRLASGTQPVAGGAHRLALISDTANLHLDESRRVAEAIQKQITRDFGPVWNVTGTVEAFAKLEDVPPGYWPVIVQQDLPDTDGFHTDQEGTPFAIVNYSTQWPLVASRQCLQMLVDPTGSRFSKVKSPFASEPGKQLEILIEVCSPLGDSPYLVDGILLHDFCTPAYFDSNAQTTAKFSHLGNAKRPLDVLNGGYISLRDPETNHWRQLTNFGHIEVRDLGNMGDE